MSVLPAGELIEIDGPVGSVVAGKQAMKSSGLAVADVQELLDERDAFISIALVNTSNSVLSITAGTPVSPSNPEIELVTGLTPKNATYVGDVSLTVTKKQAVCATFAFSISSSVPNVLMTGYIYIDGTPIQQHIHRFIANAGDVGAASMQGVTVLDPGTYSLGFYVDTDKNCDITIYEGASWGVQTGCFQ